MDDIGETIKVENVNQSKVWTLEDVDCKNTVEYAPAIAFLMLVIVLGLVGNSFAAVFFTRKAQKNVINFFISSLSVNDAITNVLLIEEVVQLFFYLSIDNIVVCKLFRALKHWLIGNSLMYMVAIAVDRYRRICLPFSTQISIPKARCIIFCMTLLTFMISSRNVFTADIHRFNITADVNATLTAFYCTQSNEESLEKVNTIFHVMDICVYTVIMSSFAILNIFLLRKVVQTKKKLQNHRLTGGSIVFNQRHSGNRTSGTDGSSTEEVNFDFTSKSEVGDVTNKADTENCEDVDKREQNVISNGQFKSGTMGSKTRTARRLTLRVQGSWVEIKITLMVIIITVVSAICFIPYFIAMITVKQDFSGTLTIMTAGEILARRSYTLNSAVNPYIMLAFNVQFRQFVTSVICCFCRIGGKVIVKMK